MARVRTIKATIEYLKEKDSNTCISEWWLRQMLRSGKLKHHRAGNRYLIDLDYLEEYLRNPPDDIEQDKTLRNGILKQIK